MAEVDRALTKRRICDVTATTWEGNGMTKKLFLLVLIGSLSTSMWAQWNAPMPPTSACGPFVLWGCSGGDGSNPAGPNPDECAVTAQRNYGGIGPYCAHHWDAGDSAWLDQCYSYYYQCRPPASPVGGCPGDCTAGGPINKGRPLHAT